MNRIKKDKKVSISIGLRKSVNEQLEDFINCLSYDCSKSELIEKLVVEFLEEGTEKINPEA